MTSWTIYLAWLLACIGTLASLVVSEWLHILPCPLCWYQRIALFPLVWLLGVGTITPIQHFFRLVAPLPFFGMMVALAQILLPYLRPLCHSGCSLEPHHGWISWMPYVSFLNFFLILLLLWCSRKFFSSSDHES